MTSFPVSFQEVECTHFLSHNEVAYTQILGYFILWPALLEKWDVKHFLDKKVCVCVCARVCVCVCVRVLVCVSVRACIRA